MIETEAHPMAITVEKTNKWVYRTVAVLLVLVLITAWFLSGMLANYSSGNDGGDEARAAEFVFTVGEADTLDLSEIVKPGTSVTYTFTVANTSGNAVSEVAETYKLTFTELGSLPLTYSLTDMTDVSLGGTSTSSTFTSLSGGITTNTETVNATSAGSTNAYASGFSASVSGSGTYKLTVSWPESENSAVYSSGSGTTSLNVEVTAEQED
ncbi:MAG: hypothetical protein LUC83_01180 [Clostridiales bacterium]|nr:hypothetical protein [Clostridiales bacterium]